MAVNPNANVDINNLSPSPTDLTVKNDEALRGLVALIEKNEIDGLEDSIASIETRMSAAGA